MTFWRRKIPKASGPDFRKKVFGISILIILLAGTVYLVYLFLWGNLFVFSPLKIGFTKSELSNVIIYLQNGAAAGNYAQMDSCPAAVEKWHDLKFREKPKLFLFKDKENYLRRSRTRARFCAFPNGSVVISPWAWQEAKEGKIPLEIYLKHELSHILLYQQMGIIAAYIRYPKWLLEGIAMASSEQMGTTAYPGREETYNYIRMGNFINPADYKTAREDKIALTVRNRIGFIYSEFGYIVDDLIMTYGKDRFLEYARQLFTESNHDKVFRQVYGIEFDIYLLDFKKRANGKGGFK